MGAPAREGKDLIAATRPFADERRARSWWHTLSTFAVIAAGLSVAALAPWWPVRVIASTFSGLLVVRGFILYHDFLHSAILRNSPLAKAIMYAYGVLVLTPPRVWRETHNYHHAHTAKVVGSHVGSFPLVTTHIWRQLGRKQRALYRIARHPLTILFGYVTVFLFGMCLSSFLRQPRKNWDSALALVVHAALVAAVVWYAGVVMALLVVVWPLFVACAAGGYLFYAQHNFPDNRVQPRQTWTYTTAALESSSYMELGPVLRWLTGNIGYHHVHHLNPTIPFYRLPEAMDAIPELQSPGITTLHPRDVWRCLRLALYDPDSGRMVPYP